MFKKNTKFLLILFILVNIKSEREYKPVIGLYGNPEPISDYTNYNRTSYPISYIRWLESFGAEVMAINSWYSILEIEYLLTKVNGILLMGGGRDFNVTSDWEVKANFILNFAISYNLPVYGTCMGFQLINVLLSEDEKILSTNKYDDVGIEHNLMLVKGIDTKLFSLFENREIEIIENNDSTLYFHHDGIDKNDFAKNELLNNILHLTSIAHDKNLNFFANSIEGKNNSIFGSQYHPEKVPYIRTVDYPLNHSTNSLIISQLIGLAFVEECRKNENRFEEKQRENYFFFNSYYNNSKFIFVYKEGTMYLDKK